MKKIDRVILALTPNCLYTGFWNVSSQVWSTKFEVIPTLIFSGTEEELKACELSDRYGQIVRLDRVSEVVVNPKREWSSTWSLFYGATLFPGEVCMTCGIDQIPLNGIFFDRIKEIKDGSYAVGFADAYGYGNPRCSSSHHVALGSTFKEVYGIADDWKSEVTKVFNVRNQFQLEPEGDLWGLDEQYSSWVLRGSKDPKIVFVNNFFTLFYEGRLDRGKGHRLEEFDFGLISQGRYTEWHGNRPFAGDPASVCRLINSIPVYTWQT
jgi:hypothetical protein